MNDFFRGKVVLSEFHWGQCVGNNSQALDLIVCTNSCLQSYGFYRKFTEIQISNTILDINVEPRLLYQVNVNPKEGNRKVRVKGLEREQRGRSWREKKEGKCRQLGRREEKMRVKNQMEKLMSRKRK